MMRLSLKKLAMTLVAYAVALCAVSLAAVAQVQTIPAAYANEHQVFTQLKAKPEAKKAKAKKMVTKGTVLAKYSKQRTPLTGKQLSELLYLVGFRGEAHKLAWCIVMRESNARPKAYNGNTSTGDNSYGIFQINMLGDLGVARRDKFELQSNEQLFNPVRSAEIAHYMSQGGKDFGAWGFGPNAYRPHGMSSIERWLDVYPGIKVPSGLK